MLMIQPSMGAADIVTRTYTVKQLSIRSFILFGLTLDDHILTHKIIEVHY